MDARSAFALALDPARLLCARGLEPDPWQRELLLANDRQVLLNCSRQSGKSTVVAALALHTLLFKPKALVLLLSPRQQKMFCLRTASWYKRRKNCHLIRFQD